MTLVSCKQKKTETSEDAQSLTFLALGDSYTIGESVAQTGRWPNQLAKAIEPLINQSLHTTIVAKTGWTTDELNQGINELELIQELLLSIHSEIEDTEDISVDDIIIKLQEINDKLSLTIKHYGTESINDMMLISFGIDYLQKNT